MSSTGGDGEGATPPDREELIARLELLRAENDELRQEYLRSRQTSFQQTAVALAVIGVLAVVGGVLLPGTRAVLFALGATGLFAAVFAYFLTPDRVVPGSVGGSVYDALATTETALVSGLGLDDTGVYVPASGETVRLFVPQSGTEVPGEAPPPGLVVDDDYRGIAFEPTGGRLVAEFERAAAEPFGRSLDRVGPLLADALVEQFELADSAVGNTQGDRLVVGVTGAAYGDPDRFDHPVASFVAVAAARSLDEPVGVTVSSDVDRVDYAITARRWDADEAGRVDRPGDPDTTAEDPDDGEASPGSDPETGDGDADSNPGSGRDAASVDADG